MTLIGLLLVALPLVMTGLVFASRDNRDRQAVVVVATAAVTFAIVAGSSLLFGVSDGDSWTGIMLVSAGPYAVVWWVLRLRFVRDRPYSMLILIPLTFLLGCFLLLLVAVNLRLISPPF